MLLVELVDNAQQVGGVQLFIGSADNHIEIEVCNRVISCFSSHRGTTGILGLIGPSRMAYPM
ncbi:MAG: heat-inducible transcriptional repressor HrcA, partial [Desulfuromonadaceae bacterium]|nr:heat-inducible transcriptional repressor HrcA [Desulfuromonadaceae bacterium]